MAILLLALLPTTASAAMSIESGPRVVVSQGQTTIWWHSSSSGSSELRWGTSVAPWASLPNDVSNTATDLGTVHSRTISHLPAGTYYFRIRSAGAAGAVTSAVHSFVVSAASASSPIASASFGGPSVGVKTVRASFDQSALFVGGNFETAGRRTGTAAGVDATTGTLRAGAPVFDRRSNVVVSDGAGGFFVGGFSKTAGGLPRTGLAHILPDGGIDPHFRFDTTGNQERVNSLLVSGTTLYVGGSFSAIGGVARSRLAAIDLSTGSVLPWNPGADNVPVTMALSGTTLYVGGHFLNVGGQARSRIAALSTTTGLATSWNPGANAAVLELLLSGSTLYAGGDFTTLGGQPRAYIGAVDAASGTASAWNPTADDSVTSIERSGSGAIHVGGAFVNIGGQARARLAALDPSTGLATSWNPGADSSVESMVQIGTTIYAAGKFDYVGGLERHGVVQLSTASSTPTSYASHTTDTVNGIAVDGTTLFIAGWQGSVNASPRWNFAVIDVATGAPTAVVADADDTVWDIEVESATSIRVAGSFTTFGGQARGRLAQLNPVSGAVASWNPNADDTVYAIRRVGTTLYVGGQFGNVGGAARVRLASVSTTTAAATSWAPVMNNSVFDLRVGGSVVYVSGAFTTAGGQPRNYVAGIDTSTAAATAWNPAPNGVVESFDTDGTTVFMAGSFTSVNGVARAGVASVPVASSTPTSWNPGVVGSVYRVMYIDGRVYLGGQFTQTASTARMGFAEFDAASGALTSLDAGLSSGNDAQGFARIGDTLVLGGNFTSAFGSGWQSRGLAAVSLAGRSDQADAPTLTITQQPNEQITAFQATIWWETSASSSSELVWDRISRTSWIDYHYDASNTATGLGTRHSRTITNLPAGTYYYRVRSRTAGGAQVTSAERTFVVASPDASTPLGSTVFNGAVNSMSPSDDETILYLGGTFDRAGQRSGTVIGANPSTGATLPGMPQVHGGSTMSMVSDGQGGYYIGGAFTSVGGLPRSGLARLLPDGGVDPTWTSSANGLVYALERSGTTLYVGGGFNTLGGASRSYIGAIDLTTGLAIAWDPNANSSIRTMALDGSSLYVGGSFTSIGGQTRGRVAELNTLVNTNNATGWNPGMVNNEVRAMVVTASVLYIGGAFTNVAGTTRGLVAGLDRTTAALTAMAPTSTGSGVYALALNGGTLYAGGRFSLLGGASRQNLGAISTSTGSATTWNPGANDEISSLAMSGTDIYVGGYFTTIAGVARGSTARLDTTVAAGTAASWTANVTDNVHVVVASSSAIMIGGTFRGSDAVFRPKLAAIDAVSGRVTNWNPGVTSLSGFVRAVVQRGGVVYVGGNYSTIGGQTRNRLAAVDATTGVVSAFNPNIASGVVNSIAVDASGTTIYAAGNFSAVNGSTTRNSIAAFNSSSGTATAWDPNATAGSSINAITALGSTLYVGGDFTTIGGATRNRLAALDMTVNTNNATAWDPNMQAAVHATLISGSRLYVAGTFGSANGSVTRYGLASFDLPSGTLNSWAPVTNGSTIRLAELGGRILALGNFTTVGGQPRARGASLDAATAAVGSWNPGLGSNASSEWGLAGVGRLAFVGGAFSDTVVGSAPQYGVSIYDPCDRSDFCGSEVLQEHISVSLSSSSVNFGSIANSASRTGTTSVNVRSNAAAGYTLSALDSSATGLECTTACGTIPDWTGTDASPSQWASSDTGTEYGFGLTVLDNSMTDKLSKWGTGTTATDFVANRYAGVHQGAATVLHRTDRFTSTATDTTTIGWRLRVEASSQTAGSYTGAVTIVAVPSA